MNKLLGFLLFLLVPLSFAQAQEATGTSTVTFGVGGAWAYYNIAGLSGGPQFNGTYEYRFHKHWAIELGVDTTVTKYYAPLFEAYLYPRPAGYLTAYPFGFRWILPAAQGKFESFIGLQGAYLLGPNNYSEWAVMPSTGVRIAVDKHRHIWLGGSGRSMTDMNTQHGQFVTFTADVGFRFGRD